MNITRITDQIQDEIYKINKNTLLVRRDTWEIWKRSNQGWSKREEVKRKDYKEYIKATNREKVKELIEVGDKVYFSTLEEVEELERALVEEKERKAQEEAKEQEERKGLDKQLREVKRALENIDTRTLTLEEVRHYRAYMEIILSNLKGEIKDTKTTRAVKKAERVEEYKASIKKYMESGKFQSVNKLCKDLGINRKTFYNLGLNEYINMM